MMKKLPFILLFAGFLCMHAVSAPVTPQQARMRAAEFMSARGFSISDKSPLKARRVRSVETSKDDNSSIGNADLSSYYVFHESTGQGYVIISGDDRTESVLGYSTHGRFDEDHLPEGLQWLLQMYAGQIEKLSQDNHGELSSPQRVKPVRRPIAPLLATLWNQDNPYNLLCPRYYKEDGTQGDRSATGCVATAIAQVMAYYRYPAQTIRLIPGYSQNYETEQGEKRVQLRNIPSGSVIDWANMLDEYHGGETEAQQQAVAQLMYWVGIGCKMGYGLSSAAGFPEGVNALINYFGYDDGTHIESRGNYSAEGWHNLLYNEIADGHPVAFAGTNSGGAHAFVLDGYDIDGLFHVNWGWGGMDNGYFRLDVLAPDDNSGIGASATPDAYNMGQDAIIGMRLPDDVTAPATAYRLTVNDWEIRNGNTFFANYVNWSGVTADWNMGIGYVGDNGEMVIVGSYQTQQLSPNTYVGREFVVRGLSAGTYHLVPVSKRASDRVWQTHVNPDITYILAEVDADGNVKLSKHPIENITMTQMSFPGNHKLGERQLVEATFSNQGDEYLREIHLLASRTDSKGKAICRTNVGIAVGGETTARFSFTPDATGTWNVWLATDSEGRNVIGQGSVVITEEGVAATHSLRYVSHSMNNRSNNVVYGNKMQGKVTILNQHSEAFDGKVRLWLFKLADNGYYYGASSIYVPMHIDPNKTAQASFFFDQLELGATYAMSILYEGGGDITDGGLRELGRTQAGILYWQQNATMSGMAPASVIRTPSAAVAIDMSSMSSAIGSVVPNENPNTLYILSEGSTCPEGLENANVIIGKHSEHITLSDSYGYFSPLSFSAASATYTRTPTADRWETIALPFGVSELPEKIEIQEFTQVDDDGNVVFAPAQQMQGNVPYLMRSVQGSELEFKAKDTRFLPSVNFPMVVGTDEHRFCGTTIRKRMSNIFVLNEEATAFLPTTSQAQVDPFRAYFTAPSSVGSIPTPQSATGIGHHLQSDESPLQQTIIYDLQGRRVTWPPIPGIYIRNGKKIIIKK